MQEERRLTKVDRPLVHMRPGIALLLVLGIMLGPVYYAYCLLFSGRTTQTVEMTERAARWVTADGNILRFSNGLAYKPVVLPLTPEMNWVTLRLSFSFENADELQAPVDLQYQASLAQLDHTVLERPINVRLTDSGSQSVDVGPMQILYPAEYVFLLVDVGEPETVPQVDLEVVENVETPARSIIWTGMVLLLVAFLLALRETIRVARKHQTP